MKKASVVAAFVLGCGATASLAWTAADDHPGKKLVDQKIAKMTAPEAMQKWMQNGQPSLGHEVLAQFEGEWDVEMKMWMDQSQPPMVSQGSSTFKRILGGRFIEQHYSSQFMGQNYEGRGMLGYDNNRQMFWHTWIDSMNTGFSSGYGNLDESGTLLTVIGEMDEPMSGEVGKAYKSVTDMSDPDEFVFEMFEILYGEPFKVMEITYSRKGI